MTIQFDANVPVPPPLNGGGRTSAHPIYMMPVGMSAFFPVSLPQDATPDDEKKALNRLRAGLQNRCSLLRKSKNRQYVVRTVTEKGVRGVRVWRQEDAAAA
jgi:hypothetical protein